MRATVVIPTYNEKDNLKSLVEGIISAADIDLIVVDDASPDGTGGLADQLAHSYENIRVIHRSGKLGLSSAIIDGLRAARTEVVGVIDADLSHPPSLIPRLLEPIMNGEADVVFASRYISGGGVENWPWFRQLTSNVARLMARPLTPVRDCMSGFFFIRVSVIEGARLDAIGFKTGLEVLVKGRYKKALEVPFIFKDRQGGKSKLTTREYVNYIRHLFKLYAFKLGAG
jgi:dolichol-phosphate mannosyltransferase